MENKHTPYGPYEKYIKRPQDFFLCADSDHCSVSYDAGYGNTCESEAWIACAVHTRATG